MTHCIACRRRAVPLDHNEAAVQRLLGRTDATAWECMHCHAIGDYDNECREQRQHAEDANHQVERLQRDGMWGRRNDKN